jgi:ribonuclease HIII
MAELKLGENEKFKDHELEEIVPNFMVKSERDVLILNSMFFNVMESKTENLNVGSLL